MPGSLPPRIILCVYPLSSGVSCGLAALLRLATLVVALGWLAQGWTLHATSPGTQSYFSQVWQTEDGLPQNAVSAVVQTSEGYLWVGTYNGLARFDGVRFTVFDSSNTPELRNCRVTALFEDPDGNLWIGHETGDLTRYRRGRFEALDFHPAWSGGKITGLATDARGDLWIQNADGLLARQRDALVLIPRSGTAAGLVGLSRDPQGRIYVLRQGGCSLLDRGTLTPLDFDGGVTNRYVQGVALSRRGGIWVAEEGRVRRWTSDGWTDDLGPAPWGLNPTAGFLEMQAGGLAAATTDQGLYLIRPGTEALHFGRTNGLRSDWLRSLCEDREGNLWIGVGTSGLAALRPSKATTVLPPNNWQDRSVLSVTAGRDGAVYVGTEGAGVYRYRSGEWTQFTQSSGISNLYVWAVSEDANGRLWAGTWGGGLYVMTQDRFALAPGAEDLVTPVTTLLHRANGSLWAGTGAGLLHYDHGDLTWFGQQQGLALANVRAVVEDKQGRVWFGMLGGGLGCLENGTIRQFRQQDGLSSDFVWCLYLDEDDTLWIGTSGSGLSRLKQGRFATINTRQGLPNNVICHIAEDGEGHFWMSSHGGIFRVNKAELNRCADGLTASIQCLTYGRGDGLPTLECSGGSQPAGCRTSDGCLWFATSRGLVVLNPLHVRTNPLPPPVLIEDLFVDGKSVSRGTNTEALELPPGRNRLEFHYTGLSFVVPEKVRFKYRLEGLEGEWMDAGNSRQITYSYVPPGRYVFRVTACNNDAVWNDEGARLEVMLLPHFWQTVWFRVALGALALAAVGGGVWFDTRRRMRRKVERAERQRAVERERTRIAKDIHDDLGASLTRITMLCQTARADLDQPEQAAEDLDRIYSTARELTRTMDEIVWAVNPQHDTLDSLATYLGRFAQDYLRVAGIRCRLDVPVQLPAWPLTAEVRHNLFLAFKEALHNIAKHAGAAEARISLALEPGGFRLTVEDDGRGFAPQDQTSVVSPELDRLASGYGLVNMQRRLAEVQGSCEVQSERGKGTKVIFVVAGKAGLK